VKWLSNKTEKDYRLLSEAEFEYAARAGTTTPQRSTNVVDIAPKIGEFHHLGSINLRPGAPRLNPRWLTLFEPTFRAVMRPEPPRRRLRKANSAYRRHDYCASSPS
jgi:formylglycine-generating enzyme required for sulfatase activity